MKALIAATLLVYAVASRQTMEEDSSLMQGLLTRHSQLTAGTNTTHSSRKDITAKLMQSATDMMKNGATPDVVRFIESTINEVETTVLGAIMREHNLDQDYLDDHLDAITTAVTAMQSCADQIGIDTDSQQFQFAEVDARKTCRAQEALACAYSRKCEKELEVLWDDVEVQEKKMREIHETIHDGWCKPQVIDPWCGVPDHPVEWDPFRWKCGGPANPHPDQQPGWNIHYPDLHLIDSSAKCAEVGDDEVAIKDGKCCQTISKEGPQSPEPDTDNGGWLSLTSQRDLDYPLLTTLYEETDETCQWDVSKHGFVTAEVFHFRSHTKTQFESYKAQKIVVDKAWQAYNTKLAICAGLETDLENKVIECDDLSDRFHFHACQNYDKTDCVKPSKRSYQDAMEDYEADKESIALKEHDRKREWETLHVITCLLKTVYTRVIHSIESGEPCPTETSDPEGTQNIIADCHQLVSVAHLDIVYGDPPEPPPLPDIGAPPCTAQYLWDDHGEFPRATREEYMQTLTANGLTGENTQLLEPWLWGGCAAPLVCIPCDHASQQSAKVDFAAMYANEGDDGIGTCGEGLSHLKQGEFDPISGAFRCRNGAQCVRGQSRCDNIPDCDDSSDEWHCHTSWGPPAVLNGEEECHDTAPSEIIRKQVQFKCNVGKCIPIEGLCNGYHNCDDESDEAFCVNSALSSPLATSGFEASIQHLSMNSEVFKDRDYTFTDLGSFAGMSYILMHNNDKYTPYSHVQMRLTLPKPTTIYIVKRGRDEEGRDHDELPWLAAQRWIQSGKTGVTYEGFHATKHHEWKTDWTYHKTYGPGTVYQKTFPAGNAEIPGSGGDGSYLIFFEDALVTASPDGSENQCLLKMQAEDPSYTISQGTVSYSKVRNQEGAYVDFESSDAEITWTTPECSGGEATLSFRYAMGKREERNLKFELNGEEVIPEWSWPYTGVRNWYQWIDQSATVTLKPGRNTITLKAPDLLSSRRSGPNFDFLTIGRAQSGVELGDVGSRWCTTQGTEMSRGWCQSAVQSLKPEGQRQDRKNLVEGDWGHLPPGCSVQYLTDGTIEDWAAHWNNDDEGMNNGPYLPICTKQVWSGQLDYHDLHGYDD